ncbi:MAG: PEP/pyruvate-binding domain-containing protein [Caldisphaera sp.]
MVKYGLVTVVPVERNSLFEVLNELGIYYTGDETSPYFFAYVKGNNNKFNKVFISDIPAQTGQLAIHDVLNAFIRDTRVNKIILAGIAGGYKKNNGEGLNIFDLTIGKEVIFIDSIAPGREPKRATPNSNTDSLYHVAHNIFTIPDKQNELKEMIIGFFYNLQEELKKKIYSFRIKEVVFGSSNHLMLRDETTSNYIESYYERYRIEAYEMEGYDFMLTCNNSGIDSLMIRGISDNLIKIEEEDKVNQPIAAKIAIMASIYLLQNLPGEVDPDRIPSIPISDQDLENLIESRRWLVGASNVNEDLHFSTLYLRNSTKKYLPIELKRYGYKNIVALYDNFYELYLIPEKEINEVSNNLINDILKDPKWFQDILNKIILLCDQVRDQIFIGYDPDSSIITDFNYIQRFKEMTNKELLDIYLKHYAYHNELYKYARIPEALDRGANNFTNYLFEYLEKNWPEKYKGEQNYSRLKSDFDALTDIEFNELDTMTLFELERHELKESILNQLTSQDINELQNSNIFMYLSPNIRNMLETFSNKWCYMIYHGYTNRGLRDINEVIEEILNSNFESREGMRKKLEDSARRRERIRNELGMEEKIYRMYRLYAKIGVVKAYRKYIQIRNFYFLDDLISEISKRLGIKEYIIRRMLPEEVRDCLKNRHCPNWAIDLNGRVYAKSDNFDIYIISGEREGVFHGSSYRELEQLINDHRAYENSLIGKVVFQGLVKGTVKIVNNYNDLINKNITRRDIIVSEKVNPDLFPLLSKAGGLITVEGGVTSHIAIQARQHRIPAIQGVEGATRLLHDGDRIELDATMTKHGYGIVKKLTIKTKNKIVHFADEIEENDYTYIGEKAQNLTILYKRGFQVPMYFIIPFKEYNDLLKKYEGKEKDLLEELDTNISYALNFMSGQLFAIRTSMIGEDTKKWAKAGEYISLTDVEKESIPIVVTKIFNAIDPDHNLESGSVIIQEMIHGDISGVTFTVNTLNNNNMIIEFSMGGAENVTSGYLRPYSIEITREGSISYDEDLIQLNNQNEFKEMINSISNLTNNYRIFKEIESLMRDPQDIEWTIKNETIYILQSRPISTIDLSNSPKNNDESNRENKKFKLNLDIPPTIYAYYKITPILRNHLYWTAALAKIILDHWKGKELRKDIIITTLLLHDLGNMVKEGIMDNDRNYYGIIRANMIRNYGDDDHTVSEQLSIKLGVPENGEVISLMRRKLYENNKENYDNKDYAAMLSAYCDQRISPSGITSLKERLDEVMRRAKETNQRRYRILVDQYSYQYAFKIEEEIQKNVNINLSEITQDDLEKEVDNLRKFKISKI